MKLLEIHTNNSHTSKIFIGESYKNVTNYIDASQIVIITDTTIKALYPDFFHPYKVIEIKPGEKNKNLKTVEKIYEELMNLEVDRSSFILGFGGGVISDITGFVASTYMRGIRFGFVSTTLLSQVDASIGGKNGVNFNGYKNIIGVFNQPEFVICDLSVLSTLKRNDFKSGFAEIIKHALINDPLLFELLENNYRRALKLDNDVLEHMIYSSLKVKACIIERDEKEKGERKKLNFGHTFGHALEKAHGISHGEAVSIGMILASRLSRIYNNFISSELSERIEHVLQKYRLPTNIHFKKDEIFDAIKKDKKRGLHEIDFILLHSIGNVFVKKIPIAQLEELFNDLC